MNKMHMPAWARVLMIAAILASLFTTTYGIRLMSGIDGPMLFVWMAVFVVINLVAAGCAVATRIHLDRRAYLPATLAICMSVAAFCVAATSTYQSITQWTAGLVDAQRVEEGREQVAESNSAALRVLSDEAREAAQPYLLRIQDAQQAVADERADGGCGTRCAARIEELEAAQAEARPYLDAAARAREAYQDSLAARVPEDRSAEALSASTTPDFILDLFPLFATICIEAGPILIGLLFAFPIAESVGALTREDLARLELRVMEAVQARPQPEPAREVSPLSGFARAANAYRPPDPELTERVRTPAPDEWDDTPDGPGGDLDLRPVLVEEPSGDLIDLSKRRDGAA